MKIETGYGTTVTLIIGCIKDLVSAQQPIRTAKDRVIN